VSVIRLTAPPSATATPGGKAPLNAGLVAANKTPRCSARSSRTGQPCKKAAITGMRVCRTHGGAAPQAREAARRRMAFLVDPGLRCLEAILNDPDHPQLLGPIKEVLARNELFGLGVEPKGAPLSAQAISVQTQVNLPEVHLASMSDQELDTYQGLLVELRELLPQDEAKRGGNGRR
jgi:hypothetical protein